ncbi:hypothetical protein BDZ45DRAFT_594457 [Acephala macrosclerotiorum]|nr:hypothetical protein BDZ45DRAFT_594457 [Acephala macrosclerotiorum]
MHSPTNRPLSWQDPEEFSIGALLGRVNEFQRRQELDTLERITMENSWLEHHIARCRETSSRTIKLLHGIYQAVALMQNTLEKCRRQDLAADRAWLAFWGIHNEHPSSLEEHPASWI